MKTIWKNRSRITALVLCFVLFSFCLVTPARASGVSGDGLCVQQANFRDVLRLYASNPDVFGSSAAEPDSEGITDSARFLAELFAYTVGLNYTGEGFNYNYFAKDITAKMDQEPYVAPNLLATYDAEIFPFENKARPLPAGEKTSIRIYLAGYDNAASGVIPILHYVWESAGKWWAVKDDNPFYLVSYNGLNAKQAASDGVILMKASAGTGTESVGTWSSLADKEGNGVVHANGCTIVAGQGTANIFAVSGIGSVPAEAGYAAPLSAISDFVEGGTTYQTGPLVYSRELHVLGSSTLIGDGTVLSPDTDYCCKVVYDEALAPFGDWDSIGFSASESGVHISDFTWYGNEEYLTEGNYNPHTIEFTFRYSGASSPVCIFTPLNLVGSISGLSAAPVHSMLDCSKAPAADEPQTAAPADTGVSLVNTDVANIPVLLYSGGIAPVSRGMLAQALWTVAGQPYTDTADLFVDFPDDPQMAQAVAWCARQGLIVGYGDGTFLPGSPVSREQAAVVLFRFAGLLGRNPAGFGTLTAFYDSDNVSSWALESMIWAVNSGILLPLNDGGLWPGETVFCGEIVDMLTQLIG